MRLSSVRISPRSFLSRLDSGSSINTRSGIEGECSSDGDSLLLSPAALVGILVLVALEIDHREHLETFASRSRSSAPRIFNPKAMFSATVLCGKSA